MVASVRRILCQRIPVLLLFFTCVLLLAHMNNDNRLLVDDNSQLVQMETDVTYTPEPAKKVEYPDGIFQRTTNLKGLVFDNNTRIAAVQPEEFSTTITMSVVKTLSDEVEQHVKEIFNDEYGECKFYATLPAMMKRNGGVEVVQRIWLAQYERMSSKYKMAGKAMQDMVYEWRNTWQENYFYSMQLDDNYNEIKAGSIMGLPTTTNAGYTYKSDGPMDPRLFTVGGHPYLSFHTWLVDPTYNDQISGRLHLYDLERNTKKKLTLNTKLHRTEINWIPLDVNGELHFTYSLDPLRVMKCDTKTAACHFIYEQEGTTLNPFVYSSDHLRGGTPWILYRYPYYISMGHNVLVAQGSQRDYSIYNANFLVMSVNPWRLVYTSRNLAFNETWVKSLPIIRNQTIIKPFFYPSGIVMQSEDVIDVSGHLNDAAGYILRVKGIKQLMEEVMARDMKNVDHTVPTVRTIQQYVLEAGKSLYPSRKFNGDIIAGTVEKPNAHNTK